MKHKGDAACIDVSQAGRRQRAYRVVKRQAADGRVQLHYARTSGQTWEWLRPGATFNKRTDASKDVPMTMLIGDQGLWLMRYVPKTRAKDTVLAKGTKGELWESFLNYVRMYESGSN